MGRRSPSARFLYPLPVTVALLVALGWIGLRARRSADAQPALRPPVARPSPVSSSSSAFPLRFDPEAVDLGRLEPGSNRRVLVAWRLEGTESRAALGMDATCGCVVAEGLPRDLSPGDRGTLTLVVRPPRRSGPFRAAVKVWLHPSPGERPPSLEVRGYVLSPVGVRPETLVLGPRTAGVRVERVLEVDVVSALAAASVEAVLEGLAGEVAVEPCVFAARSGATLRVRVQVPATPGPFAGRVVARVGSGRSVFEIPVLEIPVLEIPVTGSAVVRR